MAVQVTTMVTDVEVKGPFEKNGSQYDIHVFKTEAGEFSKSANLDSEPLANKGDTVSILYDSVKGKKSTYNKVLKIEKQNIQKLETCSNTQTGTTTLELETKGESKSRFVKTDLTKPGVVTATLYSNKVTQQKPFDNHSARVGGLLHDAVQILIHNASLDGRPVSVTDVVDLTQRLLSEVQDKLG